MNDCRYVEYRIYQPILQNSKTALRYRRYQSASPMYSASNSQQHVGEVFGRQKFSCLLIDKTTKRAKYMGYVASDSSGKLWVLGLWEMASNSAADTLSVFKEILSDIDYTCH